MGWFDWLHQLAGRSAKVRRHRARYRKTWLQLEQLEDRTTPTGNIVLTSAFLADANGNALATPRIGEQVFVRAEWTTQGLAANIASYTVRFSVDGVPISCPQLTAGAGGAGTQSWFWYLGGWFATTGSHSVQVTVNPDQTVAETAFGDNTQGFNFIPAAATNLPQKFIDPLGGTPYQNWGIFNYVDVNPLSGAQSDFSGGAYVYDGHDAHDIGIANFGAMDAGVMVRAAACGVVTGVLDGNYDRNTTAQGQPANYVVIDHGNGWQTYYYHLRANSILVRTGDTVTAGQMLGLVGSSGSSTGAHLHFAVYHNGAVVEPDLDPTTYWANPIGYQGTTGDVLTAGVTSSPTIFQADVFTSGEAPVAANVFAQAGAPAITAWFVGNLIGTQAEPGLVLFKFYKPDGQAYPGLDGSIPQITSPTGGTFYFTRVLPANLDLGTWRMAVVINGVEKGSANFQITAAGAGAARVNQGNTTSGPLVANGRTTPIDFGTPAPAATVPQVTFTIANIGSALLTLSNLVLPAGYSLVGGFPSSSAVGGSATFTLQMSTATSGVKAGVVSFNTSDPNAPTYSFSVKGTVTGGPNGALHGQVYQDSAGDGIENGADAGLAGRTVRLLNTSDVEIATTTTGNNGYFAFYNLAAGTYRVRQTLPGGWVQTTANPADIFVAGTDLLAGVFGARAFASALTIVESGGSTNVTEGGATDSFTVKLNSQPTSTVIVTLAPGNQVSLSTTTLTFTALTWNNPQTVTVTAIDDSIAEGAHTGVLNLSAASADVAYHGLTGSVTAFITDNDTASVSIVQSGGSTDVAEGGATDSYTLVLTSQPTANVVISLNPGSQVTVSPTSLTFTPINWNVARTITVTAVDDAVPEGNHTGTITHTAASSDAKYNGISIANVIAQITDNDVPGVTVSPTSGLVTTEAGGTATFSVVLNTPPAASVTIGLSSSNTAEGTVSPSSLTFTTANWNVARTVTVTGVNDFAADGNRAYTIITSATTSADATYNGLAVADVAVTNLDNDTAGITVNPTTGRVTTEAGGTSTFTIVLTSQPTADVTIPLRSSNTAEGTVFPASVTFTAANWNSPQTITITGVGDAVTDGDQAYTIITDPAVSTDLNYSGRNPADVSAVNRDSTTFTSDRPTFVWSVVAGASSYQLVVLDRDIQQYVVNLPGLTGNTHTLTAAQALTPGHAFTWYIGWFNGGVTTFNSGFQFNITPLAAPAQNGPAGTIAAALGYDRPTFQWGAVANAHHYYLYVFDNTTQRAVIDNPNVNGTSFTPGASQALTPGHNFTWYVAAVSTNGGGFVYAPLGQNFTLASLPSPTRTGLIGNITAAAGFDTPTFTWSTVVSAHHYYLYVVDNNTGQAVIDNSNVPGTSFTPTAAQALIPGHSFTWYVAAVSTDGQTLAYDTAGRNFSLASLTAPTQGGPNGGIAVGTGFDTPTFTWTSVVGASAYYLYVVDTTTNNVVVNNPNVMGTSFIATAGLTSGHSFTWYVGALSANGLAISYNPAGRQFSLAPLTSPGMNGPTGTLAAATGYDRPTFAWTSVVGAHHYYLYVVDQTSAEVVIDNPNVNATSFTPVPDKALTPGHHFIWYVAAASTDGNALSYLATGATFNLADLPAPTQLGPTGSATTLPTFTWTAVAGADHYYLYVADTTSSEAIINLPHVTGTTFAPGAPLTRGRNYTWYLAAVSANGLVTSYLTSGMAFDIP